MKITYMTLSVFLLWLCGHSAIVSAAGPGGSGQSAEKSATGAGHEYDNVPLPKAEQVRAAVLDAAITVKEDHVLHRNSKWLLGWNAGGSSDESLFMDKTHTRIAPDSLDVLRSIPAPLVRINTFSYQPAHWKDAVGAYEKRIPINFGWGPVEKKGCGALEFIRIMQSTHHDVEFIWCLNLKTDTAQDHKDLAQMLLGVPSDTKDGVTNWANLRRDAGIEKPVPVLVWELGNETDWPDPVTGKTRMFTVDQYIEKCREAISAIRSVEPHAKFAMHAKTGAWQPAIAKTWSDFHKKILQKMGNEIDYIVLHPYYLGMPVSVMEDEYVDVIRQDILAITGSDRVKIILTEHALWPNLPENAPAGTPWKTVWYKTHALMGCLGAAQFINRMAGRPDVEMMNYHSLSAGPWGAMYYSNKADKRYATGIADTFRVLYDAFTDDLFLPVVTGELADAHTPNNAFTVTAAKTPKGMNLIVVNRSPITKRNTAFMFEHKYTLKKITTLTAKSLHSYNSVNEKNIFVTKEDVNVPDIRSYQFPAKSLVTLTLEKN